MALGWNEINQVDRLREKAHALGFMMTYGRNSYTYGDSARICLQPRDDELPPYSRDAEVFYGTVEELTAWLIGIEWARNYDAMIKLTTDKKREAAEQTERNRQLMYAVKHGTLSEKLT
jgi:hypothetical protein